MRITLQMLLEALKLGDDGMSRYTIKDTGIIGIDGWFDLAKAAERLNAELLRQAQTSQAGMLDLNVSLWEGACPMVDDGPSNADLNAWLTRLNSMNLAVDHFAECRRAAEVVEALRRTRERLNILETERNLAADRLDGAEAIANFRGEPVHRTRYLLRSGLIPHGREGDRIVASKRVLWADWKRRTDPASPGNEGLDGDSVPISNVIANEGA